MAYIDKNTFEVGEMWFLSGILLAISLSMDALGIGISYGLRNIKVPNIPRLIISFISLLFTAIAIGIGNVIVLFLPDYLAKLVGSGMLGVLGAVILVQALREDKKVENKEKKTEKVWNFNLKSLGIIIKVTHHPISCDSKKSASVGIKESIYMGIALSIDSFGAGISSAVSGVNDFFVPVMVGLCQFIFFSLGIFCGRKLTAFKKIDSKVFVILSGILLIILAVVRYFL